ADCNSRGAGDSGGSGLSAGTRPALLLGQRYRVGRALLQPLAHSVNLSLIGYFFAAGFLHAAQSSPVMPLPCVIVKIRSTANSARRARSQQRRSSQSKTD